jgi:hypothetical protein
MSRDLAILPRDRPEASGELGEYFDRRWQAHRQVDRLTNLFSAA